MVYFAVAPSIGVVYLVISLISERSEELFFHGHPPACKPSQLQQAGAYYIFMAKNGDTHTWPKTEKLSKNYSNGHAQARQAKVARIDLHFLNNPSFFTPKYAPCSLMLLLVLTDSLLLDL